MRLINIKKSVQNILGSKELVLQLIWKELKLRYKNSILGFFWTLIDPLLMIAVSLLVFTKLFRYELPYYPSYLLIGIFIWNYFSEATMKGLYSLSSHADILTKTAVPKWVIILSANLFSMLDFILKFVVLLIILVLLRVFYAWPSLININLAILYIPVILAFQFMLVLGLSQILSISYVHFRDIQNMWGILLHIGFFLTPIFYPESIIPTKYRVLLMINPLNHLIEAYRQVIIQGKHPSFFSFILIAFFSSVIMLIGMKVLKKFQHTVSQQM